MRAALCRTFRGGESVHQAMHTAALSEEVVVHRLQVAPVPASASLEVAALLGWGVATGFGAVVDRADLQPGSSVVVVGASGVGPYCIQGAAFRPAEPIVDVDLVEAKRTAALALGATLDPAGGDLGTEIRALTGGRE